jgi:hypothetical protein
MRSYPETFKLPVNTAAASGTDDSWRDTLAPAAGFLASAYKIRVKNTGANNATIKLKGIEDVADNGSVLFPSAYEDFEMTNITDVLITSTGTTIEIREWPEGNQR